MSNYSWKPKQDGYSLWKSTLKSSSSSKLSEFHSKLVSKTKVSSNISIPSWKVFRSQIRNNVSPPRLEKPKLDYYSDIASFRSNSPRVQISPSWRSRMRSGSITSNVSGTSSPRLSRPSKVVEVIKIEELRRAVELLSNMDESEVSSLPTRYIQEMQEFSKVVKEKIKGY